MVNYLINNYEKVIEYGCEISEKEEFKKSNEKIAFAWALYFTGNKDKSKSIFQAWESRYTNFVHRYKYCKMLIEEELVKEAVNKLNEMKLEIEDMERIERRNHQEIYKSILKLLKQTVS